MISCSVFGCNRTPNARLAAEEQAVAIRALLALPDDVALPDPRLLVPEMAAIRQRHPELNLLNIEVASAARVLDARVLLSPRAAEGLLPNVLTVERVSWRVVEIG